MSNEKQTSLWKFLKGPDAPIWERGTANEFGHLLPDGIGKNWPKHDRIEGNVTIFSIRKRNIPAGRKVTYTNFVCNIHPQNKETHRVQMNAGGNQLDYPGDPRSSVVSVLDAKIQINSTISDAHKGAQYMGLDVVNF